MKNAIYMFFLVVSATVFGGLISRTVAETEGLRWLAYSGTFAFEPGTLNLSVLTLNFGISLSITVAQILLIICALVIYTKTSAKVCGK